MNTHDYTAEQALQLLLRKLEDADQDLAAQVRAAIDAGKDIEEEEPSSSRRKKIRRYRKAVRLSTEEALAAAIDVLQAYFLEQPLFVSSAMDNTLAAALAGPRDIYEWKGATQPAPTPYTGLDAAKLLEIELRVETQLTPGGDETYQIQRPNAPELQEQRTNVSHVRALLRFEPE